MKTGIQLYLFRNHIKTPQGMVSVVSRLVDMGFEGIELFHPFVLSPKSARAAAGNAKLINPHVELCDLRRNPERAAVWAEETGVETMCFSRLVPFFKIFGLPAVLKTIERASAAFQKHGIKLCYHNHRAEMAENCKYLSLILKNAEVVWECDAYWAQKAGADLNGALERFGDRIAYLHLKDANASGRMCPLGEGVTDLNAPVTLARQYGCEWVVADIDRTDGDLYSAARKSLHTLRALI